MQRMQPPGSAEPGPSSAEPGNGIAVIATSATAALVVSAVTLLLPWPIRRRLLNSLCGYSIARDARIGLSLIGCPFLRMGAGARIGHFNVVKGARLELGEHARIGDLNWISGVAAHSDRHFHEEPDRQPALLLERHAALTSRHYVDCSNLIHVGEFATIAGARSQILTHAIDFTLNRQVSAPVRIGRYCFVGTGCVLLKGSRLPDCSVLGANSTLARGFETPFSLYSGVPATHIRSLDRDAPYFHRKEGFVT